MSECVWWGERADRVQPVITSLSGDWGEWMVFMLLNNTLAAVIYMVYFMGRNTVGANETER